MKEHILEVLKQIEIDYRITILYACESGSRAWGTSSKNSDYDVRFIYVHPTEWYLSIDQNRDVLEVPKHDALSIPVDSLLDLNGWELTKALRLFRKSNPPLLEWLHSNIVYYQAYNTIEKIKELEPKVFSSVPCLYHYVKMAKGNYRDYLKRKEVKIKRYFNILRPLFAAKWIASYQEAPPIEFNTLLAFALSEGLIRDKINSVIQQKIAGDVIDLEPVPEIINPFIENEIEKLETYTKELKVNLSDPTQQLNQLFRETLEEVWN